METHSLPPLFYEYICCVRLIIIEDSLGPGIIPGTPEKGMDCINLRPKNFKIWKMFLIEMFMNREQLY